jgi:hypothetical protein
LLILTVYHKLDVCNIIAMDLVYQILASL